MNKSSDESKASSVENKHSGNDYAHFSIQDQSRLSVENTNAFSYSEELKEQKKSIKQNQSEKKNESIDISYLTILQADEQSKTLIKAKVPSISLIHQALNTKIQSRKSQITIYFFNSDKRMCFPRQQISKAFQSIPKHTIKQLIPYVIKSYCRLFLNFQPIQICEELFQLKIANFQNHQDFLLEPISHEEHINHLFQADNLVLVRKPRGCDRINNWRAIVLKEKPELEIVQVLMPSKRELVQHVDKSKSINFLKQKILSYNSQLGKIVLISYYSFKICQGKKKISEMQEKIFQVYRQKEEDFIDKPVIKNLSSQKNSYNNVNYYQQLWKNPSSKQQQSQSQPNQIYVNQTALQGKLTLSINLTQIIQKYTGGFYALFDKSFRTTNRGDKLSIHSLVGLRNQNNFIRLKFFYKNRQQIKLYYFQYNQKKQTFLKMLLKVARVYNKVWTKI